MASCLDFIVARNELFNEIQRLNEEAQSTKIIHFMAAKKIQAWFRGIVTRNHIRMLNTMATVIQRHWRGYRTRIDNENVLIKRVEAMWKSHYDFSARIIQAAWRRYRTQRTGLNSWHAKKYISSVQKKNQETREKIRSFREVHLQHAKVEIERESLLWILFILFKLHHLMGTKSCPGVLGAIDRKHRTSIEKMLKCLEYSVYVERKRLGKSTCEYTKNNNEIFFTTGSKFEKCEKVIRDYEKISKKLSVDSEILKAKKSSLKIQVKNLAKTLWGDDYEKNICCCFPSTYEDLKK